MLLGLVVLTLCGMLVGLQCKAFILVPASLGAVMVIWVQGGSDQHSLLYAMVLSLGGVVVLQSSYILATWLRLGPHDEAGHDRDLNLGAQA